MKQTVTKKQVGDLGEQIAVRYLRRHGYWIRERNWRAGKDEIDIIASTLRDVVFVEVKTRRYDAGALDNAPPPSLAVHAHKQQHTRTCAKSYLASHRTHKQPRMDVIEVWLSKDDEPRLLRLHHIKAAY